MALIPFTLSGPEDGGNFERAWSGDYLEAHFLSDVGKKREHNEDSCILCAPEDDALRRERGVLIAVADGMGGVGGGEFASQLALKTIAESFFTAPIENIPERLRQSVMEANGRIFEEAGHQPQLFGMGTTVSALAINGNHAYIAQVGDSRIYLLRDGHLIKQLTQDHSLVAEQVRNGQLSEQEARNHTLKNLITRAVGTREALAVDLFTVHVGLGDSILICSDGLTNLVEDEYIAEAMRKSSLQAAVRLLVGRALDGGGHDNITAALVRVTQNPPDTHPDEGAVEVAPMRQSFMKRVMGYFKGR